jgi:uncharacterized SAM-binding protein YcdF (DUF218 family)
VSSLLIALVFAGLYAWSRRRDPRLLRNGLFFVASLWFALWGVLTALASASPTFGLAVIVILALTPLTVVVLAGFAIANGVTVIRAEGLSLATSLSLLAGVGLLVLPAVMVALVLTRNGYAIATAALLFFVASYLGVVFIGFLVYSLVYGRTAQQTRPAVLVVLGSRIIDGRVPPLLRSRLDTALDVYRRDRLTGPAPLLIPSGGQGADESRSEGEAMAEYLIAQGADPADVRPETRAVNTRENLLLAREIQAAAGRPGPVLAVTSNYHVLRAAVLAREVGSDAQVIGSPTARYYVPSAFLREFVAVLVQQRRAHLLIVLPFLALTAIAVTTLRLVG